VPVFVSAAACVLFAAPRAHRQTSKDFPSRRIRIVVPFVPAVRPIQLAPDRAKAGRVVRSAMPGVVKAAYAMRGVGPFTHADVNDRPPEVFGGTNALHFSAERAPYVLLPAIPQG
jgi:hypothetical protein